MLHMWQVIHVIILQHEINIYLYSQYVTIAEQINIWKQIKQFCEVCIKDDLVKQSATRIDLPGSNVK